MTPIVNARAVANRREWIRSAASSNIVSFTLDFVFWVAFGCLRMCSNTVVTLG
jgi:hypothetical protein